MKGNKRVAVFRVIDFYLMHCRRSLKGELQVIQGCYFGTDSAGEVLRTSFGQPVFLELGKFTAVQEYVWFILYCLRD